MDARREGLEAQGTISVAIESRPGPEPEVISHEDGAIVDLGERGVMPLLEGTVNDPDSVLASVIVSDGTDTAEAELRRHADGTVDWSVLFGSESPGPVTYTIVATDTSGASSSTAVTLEVLPPPDNAIIVSPYAVVLDGASGSTIFDFDPISGELLPNKKEHPKPRKRLRHRPKPLRNRPERQRPQQSRHS